MINYLSTTLSTLCGPDQTGIVCGMIQNMCHNKIARDSFPTPMDDYGMVIDIVDYTKPTQIICQVLPT